MVNVLQAIAKAFGINYDGDIELGDFPLTTLQSVYGEMVMESEELYNLKNFLRTKLKPSYKLLFDLVHKVLLSQTGSCD